MTSQKLDTIAGSHLDKYHQTFALGFGGSISVRNRGTFTPKFLAYLPVKSHWPSCFQPHHHAQTGIYFLGCIGWHMESSEWNGLLVVPGPGAQLEGCNAHHLPVNKEWKYLNNSQKNKTSEITMKSYNQTIPSLIPKVKSCVFLHFELGLLSCPFQVHQMYSQFH